MKVVWTMANNVYVIRCPADGSVRVCDKALVGIIGCLHDPANVQH